MKVIEWIVAISLVIIGLTCLTMSANLLGDQDSFGTYLNTFLKICLWAGVPALVAAVVYFLFVKKG